MSTQVLDIPSQRPATRGSLTSAEAYPLAMALLVDLSKVVGDREGIQEAITHVLDEHPHDWPVIVASALGWCFAEHTRIDPDHPTTGATT